MEVNVYNIKGEDTGRKIALNDSIFGIEPNDHAIYMDVKLIMANKRQGTHKSKERSEVSHSTRKIGRQKGGGGARRGDLNSPVLIGGGRVFGPTPRDYSFKLNKKVKDLDDWLKESGIITDADLFDWYNTNSLEKTESMTLPYCVRNNIDHPLVDDCDLRKHEAYLNNSKFDNKDLIRRSIEIMRNAIISNPEVFKKKEEE